MLIIKPINPIPNTPKKIAAKVIPYTSLSSFVILCSSINSSLFLKIFN